MGHPILYLATLFMQQVAQGEPFAVTQKVATQTWLKVREEEKEVKAYIFRPSAPL
jgi:hypothetical protein